MKLNRFKSLLPMCALVISATTFVSCNNWDDELDELDNQKSKWAENEPASYEYWFEHICYCDEESSGPFVVTVRNGEMVSVKLQSRETSEWYEITPSEEYSIAHLFDEIERHLEDDPDSGRTNYDDTYGYPTDVYFDMKKSWADDEWGVAVIKFEVSD